MDEHGPGKEDVASSTEVAPAKAFPGFPCRYRDDLQVVLESLSYAVIRLCDDTTAIQKIRRRGAASRNESKVAGSALAVSIIRFVGFTQQLPGCMNNLWPLADHLS